MKHARSYDIRREGLVSAIALTAALGFAALPHVAVGAEAQVAPQEADPMLSEVVVTASRRSSTALSTPIDISAVTGADLAKQGIEDFRGLTRVAPGLIYNGVSLRDGGTTNGFILHGLNLDSVADDTPLATKGPVSVYVNETPAFVNLQLADVERVEVLRGPQGTLYGDASIAGTVRVLFNKPDLTRTTAEITTDASWTRHAGRPNYGFDAVVNRPLSESLGLRLAGGYTYFEGVIDAPFLYQLDAAGVPVLADPSDPVHSLPASYSRKDVDDGYLAYLRPSLLWETDKAKVLLMYQYQHQRSDFPTQDSYPGGPAPTAFSSVGSPFSDPPFQNDGFDAAFPSTFKEYQTGNFLLQPMTRDVHVGSIEASYDLGFATLTSVTSAYETENEGSNEYSGFYQQSLGFFYQGYPRLSLRSDLNYKESAFIEEVRLVSKGEGPLTYSVGAFFMNQNNRMLRTDVVPGFSAYETALGVPNTGTDVGFLRDRKFRFRDLAAFGELSYRVTDKLQLTGGVRVYRQKLDIRAINALPICGSFCSADGVDPLGLSIGTEQQKTNKALWKFNASYTFRPGLLSYFTFSQGSRRGGANGTPTFGPFAEDPAFQFFRPDTVDNYELGLKGRFGGRFEFSSAAYWVEWKNPQVSVLTPNGSFVAAVNGESARSRGFDLEARVQAAPGLRLNATYGYNKAELTAPIVVANAVYGASGDSLPGTPHHTASFGVDYDHPVSDELTFLAHADVSWRSGMSTSLTPSENVDLSGFAMLNARIGVERGAYRLTLYANNITSTRGVLSAQNPLRWDVRALNRRLSRPLTVGMRFNYKYD